MKILTGHISVSSKKYKDLREECIRNGWITNAFPIEVWYRGFITNSITAFLTNLWFSPSDKSKYIKKIKVRFHQGVYGNPIEWQQSNKVWWYRELLLWYTGFVVMMLRPRNHAWTLSTHLIKALLEPTPLYKHHTYIIHKHIYNTYIHNIYI